LIHCGLIGSTTGSGKSNLLHVLITQLALVYPPAELALYLLDFREGVEFQDYLRLPQVRVIALESEREFGLRACLIIRFRAHSGSTQRRTHDCLALQEKKLGKSLFNNCRL